MAHGEADVAIGDPVSVALIEFAGRSIPMASHLRTAELRG